MGPRLLHVTTASGFTVLPFSPLFELLNHALFHHVNVCLLLFEAPARHFDVLLEELELVEAQIAVLTVLHKLLVLCFRTQSASLELILPLFSS